jgi:hypothetical protein
MGGSDPGSRHYVRADHQLQANTPLIVPYLICPFLYYTLREYTPKPQRDSVVDSGAKGCMILPRIQKLPYDRASLVYFRPFWPYDIAKTLEIPI